MPGALVIAEQQRTRRQEHLAAPTEPAGVGIKSQRNMLLEKERHWLGDRIHEHPKTNLFEHLGRKSLLLITKRGHQLPTLKSEEGVSREEKTEVVTFTNPLLKVA